jgi:hypothetical protein
MLGPCQPICLWRHEHKTLGSFAFWAPKIFREMSAGVRPIVSLKKVSPIIFFRLKPKLLQNSTQFHTFGNSSIWESLSWLFFGWCYTSTIHPVAPALFDVNVVSSTELNNRTIVISQLPMIPLRIDWSPDQTRMKVDESWQSRIDRG